MHLVSDHSLNKQVLYNCKCDVLSKLIPWSRILVKLMLLNQAYYQVHNCQVHKGFPLFPILSQRNPVYTLSSYVLNIRFNPFFCYRCTYINILQLVQIRVCLLTLSKTRLCYRCVYMCPFALK
jgi:hypothetical protein